MGGMCDFVYVPVSFKTGVGRGQAYVNLTSPDAAQRCINVLEDLFQCISSLKECSVTWGHPLQGPEAHVERYRNSPVMHADVPEDWKPMLFRAGVLVPFPCPTKAVERPKMRLGTPWSRRA